MTTIKEVAEMAGVSVATVSHVVRKTRYVSPELERKVEEVIASLDSVPNFVLKQNKKNENKVQILLVYVPNFSDKFQMGLLAEIRRQQTNKNVLVIPVEYQDITNEFEVMFDSFAEKIIGQILIYSEEVEPTFPKKFYKIPFVIISANNYETITLPYISSDSCAGVEHATNHLIKSGHSRIAYIDYSEKTENDSLIGFKQAFQKSKLEIDEEIISTKRLSEHELFEKLHALFSQDNLYPPTGIFVDPLIVDEVISYFKKTGYRIPEDISIISLGTEAWYALCDPAITSIEHDFPTIIAEALDVLHSYTADLQIKKVVSTTFHLQNSTSGIAKGPFGEKAYSIDSIMLTEKEIAEIKQKKRTAVISFHYTGASWMNLHEAGINKLFNELNINVIGVTDAHFDAELQNKQIDSLLSLEPDIFIAIPTDTAKTAEAFKKIVESPSDLILITNVPKGLTPNDYVSVVSVNELTNGRLAARGLCEQMVSNGKSKVGLITFDSDFYATNQRDTSAQQLIDEDFPAIEIVAQTSFKNESEVFDKTLNLLAEHPEIEGIYISWDGPAQQVIKALTTIDRLDIIVGTVDLDFSSALVIAEDGPIKCVSAQQPFEQGRAIALAAAQSILHKHVPSFIGIEPIMVNKGNLLSSWRTIFKEEPPKELRELLSRK
ncbi:LacI family DNA-binding transcriptional regulator [Enterococcus raffinosus]|uniref:LacI family DNA-binding transcriptional regulator n=1 Tax=Enterococcus raffinosus TaxID=71452 RepID=UPI001C126ABA|nr:LacI family DNA-binding transcriptional regulator [Enterococcus raffinosus]MBU5363006.1 LacI family DNA-binding transcriptional regulator [Enterococcus raffinosus]